MKHKCNNPECKSNPEGKPIKPITVYGDENRVNGRQRAEEMTFCNLCHWVLGQVVRS